LLDCLPNPAIVQVGDSYADLGATVSDTGPGQAGDTNLGLKTFLKETLVSNIAPAPTSRAKLGTKQEVFMSKQLRLTIYKEGSTNYRYLVHGANPSLRGRFRIPIPLTGNSELVAIKDALRAGSHRLEPFIANLKVVPRYSAAQKARSASPV